jgi:hypothetical protein
VGYSALLLVKMGQTTFPASSGKLGNLAGVKKHKGVKDLDTELGLGEKLGSRAGGWGVPSPRLGHRWSPHSPAGSASRRCDSRSIAS